MTVNSDPLSIDQSYGTNTVTQEKCRLLICLLSALAAGLGSLALRLTDYFSLQIQSHNALALTWPLIASITIVIAIQKIDSISRVYNLSMILLANLCHQKKSNILSRTVMGAVPLVLTVFTITFVASGFNNGILAVARNFSTFGNVYMGERLFSLLPPEASWQKHVLSSSWPIRNRPSTVTEDAKCIKILENIYGNSSPQVAQHYYLIGSSMRRAAMWEYYNNNIRAAENYKQRSLVAFNEALAIFENNDEPFECAATLAESALSQILNETQFTRRGETGQSRSRVNAEDIEPGKSTARKAIAYVSACLLASGQRTNNNRPHTFTLFPAQRYRWDAHALSNTIADLHISVSALKLYQEQDTMKGCEGQGLKEQQLWEQAKNQFPDCSNILIAVFVLLLEYCTLQLWSLKLQKSEQTARDIVEKSLALKRRIDFELFRGETTRALALSAQLLQFAEKEKSS